MAKTPDEIKKGMEITSKDCLMCKCCATDCPYDLECHPGNEETNANVPKAMLRDGLALIQQLEAKVPHWISVKERLPKQGVNVPVIFSDGYVGMGQWLGWGWCGYVYRTTNNVTHWMPLPEPPEE